MRGPGRLYFACCTCFACCFHLYNHSTGLACCFHLYIHSTRLTFTSIRHVGSNTARTVHADGQDAPLTQP
jgi:hypothetical protein